MLAAVDMGAEQDAIIGDTAQGRQAENLEAAAIGKDCPIPGHELMQSPELFHHLDTRPEVEVIGIGQHHPGADVFKLLRNQGLDRGLAAHREEDRSGHYAVRRMEFSGAGFGAGVSC